MFHIHHDASSGAHLWRSQERIIRVGYVKIILGIKIFGCCQNQNVNI